LAARRRGSRRATTPRTRPTSAERGAGEDDLMTACASHLRVARRRRQKLDFETDAPAGKNPRLSRQL
jgi:hypothetical protein